MGIFSRYKSCSVYGDKNMGACHITRRRGRPCGVYHEDERAYAPNPDPAKFKILKVVQVGRHVVAKINYPNCTNFEGNKICLFLCTNVMALRQRQRLDPHFSEELNSPFARFKPDEDGWNIAIKVAENIK